MTASGGRPDRLGIGDLMTFWAEESSSAWNIALAGVLAPDGLPGTGHELREAVTRRLDAVPELRRRVLWTRAGRPVWVDDERFDIAHHVALVRLPGASTARFLAWTASWAARPLARNRPLWRMALVTGLRDGNVGLAIAVHHAMADGVGGAALVARLLDGPQHRRTAAVRWRPVAPPTTAALAVDALRTRFGALGAALRAMPHWAASARAVRADVAASARAVNGRAADLGLPSPTGTDRRFATVTWRLEELRAIGHGHGATVNDVVLAAVGAGLRTFLERDDVPSVRASVPVAAAPGARNAGGTLPMVVRLPVAERDPERALRSIVVQTRALKAARDRDRPGLAASPFLPVFLARAWTRWLRREGGRRVNLFVTNVPGPAGELRFGGARLLAVHPIAPVVAGVPLALAVLSYAGDLTLTVNAGPHVPGLERIVAGADTAVRELGYDARLDERHPTGARSGGARVTGHGAAGA